MKLINVFLFLAVLLLLVPACAPDKEITLDVQPVESPAAEGSAQPNLSLGDDGRLYLSWIEPLGVGHALRFAVWEDSGWSAARTIAAGDNWFVNWADFPSMAAARDGTLLAHWLAKSGSSTYAYDIMLALSADGGASWSEPFSPHDDGTRTEHGFVTIVPRPDSSFEILWLDGRETAVDDDDRPSGSGVMTLRSARLDREGAITDGRLVDERVCDCCSTAAVLTQTGSIVAAFRDRFESEVRDIALARLETQGWVAAGLIHDDLWEIAACPVNGPALTSTGAHMACAWFTAPQEGTVNVAFSVNGGLSFGDPLRVDSGKPVGRVGIVQLDDGTAVVSWLEEGAVRLRWMAATGPRSDPILAVATEETRAAGVPQLARLGNELFLAWTETGEPSRVRTARLPADLPN
jgi:hypothetical protein